MKTITHDLQYGEPVKFKPRSGVCSYQLWKPERLVPSSRLIQCGGFNVKSRRSIAAENDPPTGATFATAGLTIPWTAINEALVSTEALKMPFADPVGEGGLNEGYMARNGRQALHVALDSLYRVISYDIENLAVYGDIYKLPGQGIIEQVIASERENLAALLDQRSHSTFTGGAAERETEQLHPGGRVVFADSQALDALISETRARIAWFESYLADARMPGMEVW